MPKNHMLLFKSPIAASMPAELIFLGKFLLPKGAKRNHLNSRDSLPDLGNAWGWIYRQVRQVTLSSA